MSALTMTRRGPRLGRCTVGNDRWPGIYGVGSLLQLSPTHAALIANRRVVGHSVIDFEDGGDVFVFDRLAALQPDAAQPLLRDDTMPHPRTGEPLIVVKFVINGGFVPLGARLADGAPHPAAGTGFVFSLARAIPADLGAPSASHDDVPGFHELIQLRFDGTRLTAAPPERLEREDVLPPWFVTNRALGNPIPDGADLLFGLVAGPAVPGGRIPCDHPNAGGPLGRNIGSGLSRWRFGPRGWRPVDYVPISGPDLAFEPSVVRDLDGSLLFCVRGKGSNAPPGELHDGLENTYEHFRVWRSTDGGRAWERVIHLPCQRAPTPVVLNLTVGGAPFLAGNPYRPIEKDANGVTIISIRRREVLNLWALTPDRRGVEPPLTVLDTTAEFGPPRVWASPTLRHCNRWSADHPVGGVIRLADGQWHSLLCIRVGEWAMYAGAPPLTPPIGLWLEEVAQPGETPRPPWRF